MKAIRLLLLALLPAAPLHAQSEVTLNLKDADISSLIETVSDVTGRNFIVDPRVKAKVNVVSSSPMTAEAVYETFLSILQVYGFAAIPSGNAIKIVPENNARQDGGSEQDAAAAPPDEIVTRVVEIENVPAAQLVPILRPLVPQWGHLAAYSPSNMLIISDRAANIRRLDRIIREIDRAGDDDIEMVRLDNASATEVVETLQTLGDGQNQQESETPATIIADERTNSVLIGGDRSRRQRMIDIVRSLDIEIDEDGDTQVVYLRHADAEDLAAILEGYAPDDGEDGDGEGGSGSRNRRSGDSEEGGIIADEATNSLVITASPKRMRSLRGVIEKLDIQRAQVMVETLIAEISSTKQAELGLDWAVFNEDRIAAAGIFDPTTGQVISNLAGLGGSSGSGFGGGSSGFGGGGGQSAAGAIGSLLGQGVTAGFGRINDGGTSFGVLIKALQGDGDTNILSAPTLLTMDNEEAEFSVGQEVPFLTGQFTDTGTQTGSVNPFQTIEREDVGLTLNLTPQINEGEQVKLQIDLEVSSLSASSAGDLNQITNSRSITNTVSVEDGQILILGGLIDDNVSDSRSGIPFLSKIPIIGSLFRFQSVQSEKRNLMLFMRPRILRDRAAADFYTRRKYEQTRKAQEDTDEHVPILGREYPRLQEFEIFLDEEGETGQPLSGTVGATPDNDGAASAPEGQQERRAR